MNSNQPPYGTNPDADDSESRRALAPFAATLRSASVWAELPDGLDDAIIGEIRAGSAEFAVAPVPPKLGRRASFARRLLPAVAAAAVAFVVGFAIAARDTDDVNAVADVELTGTGSAPDASASGDVVDRGAGYAIRLDMDGLPPAPDGEYYEGWVRAADGEMVSVGTFHMRGGDASIVLWSGVRIAEYDTLIVTKQVERAPDDTSDDIVLEGHIERRA